MTTVSEIRNLLQGVEYRNQPEVLMDYMLEDDSISDGAYRLFHLIYKDGYFDELFSIAKSKQKLADKLKTSVSSINRRLKELEKAGYINIIQQKSNKEWLPSRISVDLPEPLIKLLEDAPTRRKAIAKCGTVAKAITKDSSNHDIGGTVTGERGVHSSVRLTPYINNIYKNNNTNTLASEESKTHSKPECDSSVVVSGDIVINKPIAYNQPRKSIEACSRDNQSEVVNSSNGKINLFGDDGLELSQASKQKVSEIERIKKCIDNWQQELACLPRMDDVTDSAEKYKLVRHIGKLKMWIQQHQDKLEHLNKPVKQESLPLSNGKRNLTENNYKKLNSVLIETVDSGKITKAEANKTLKSMIHSILHGYYFQENVEVAKSVNSVIKKFKVGEWNNSGINAKDRVSRPQPRFWNASKYRNNKINFSKVLKNVN